MSGGSKLKNLDDLKRISKAHIYLVLFFAAVKEKNVKDRLPCCNDD